MSLRQALTQFTPRGARGLGRNAFPSVRRYATQKKAPSPLQQRFTVWKPYMRLAFGVPFLAVVIYSMVR